ncbi:hypothetical protein PR202_ga20253 [Eleusine coracana subsp. coracana]|uniref:FBD domain-containing protein n=1 Tax=Eleusine coracana subsp. coracana TaxID=191504 RepID=A0AAV5CW55_ELECO|nr:hypothetical protein PR202_ga20253 [Eleusine coracana subsp. coracana]
MSSSTTSCPSSRRGRPCRRARCQPAHVPQRPDPRQVPRPGILELKGCDCLFRELVSTSLKSLVIDAGDRGFRVQLVVTAPALVSIRLAFGQSSDPRSFVLNGAEGSLSQAWIGESFGTVNNNLSTLLGSMCNIRTLELWRFGYRIDKLLEDERKEFPKLHNLTTLLMGQCDMREEFDILRFFMENVPSLEKVTLRHCKELNLIDIKYQDGNISNLFGLLMGIRIKLDTNIVTLKKVRQPSLKIRIRLKRYSHVVKETKARAANFEKTFSQSRNPMTFQCPKLKSTEIIHYGSLDNNLKQAEEERESFEDFADQLLANNIAIAGLDMFRLHVANRQCAKQAARWIRCDITYSAPKPGVQRDLASKI